MLLCRPHPSLRAWSWSVPPCGPVLVEDLVAFVRSPINKLQRKKVNTLIILDVHARDIVDRFVRDSAPKEDLELYGCYIHLYARYMKIYVYIYRQHRECKHVPIYSGYR